MDRAQAAKDNFLKGYNCSQSVVLAFSDLLGIEEHKLLALASSFGGGIGRMREVCGTLLGAYIVLGVLYGYDDPKSTTEKNEHYKAVREIADSFKKEQGSIICREILGSLAGRDSHIAEIRTEEYYQKRPCPELCYLSAQILDDYIKNHPIKERKQ